MSSIQCNAHVNHLLCYYYAIGLNPGVDRFFIGSSIVILVTNVAVSFGNYQLGINLNIKNKASPLISVNL